MNKSLRPSAPKQSQQASLRDSPAFRHSRLGCSLRRSNLGFYSQPAPLSSVKRKGAAAENPAPLSTAGGEAGCRPEDQTSGTARRRNRRNRRNHVDRTLTTPPDFLGQARGGRGKVLRMDKGPATGSPPGRCTTRSLAGPLRPAGHPLSGRDLGYTMPCRSGLPCWSGHPWSGGDLGGRRCRCCSRP